LAEFEEPGCHGSAGKGDDRVELVDKTDITAKAVLDGGDGVDTLALQDTAVDTSQILGTAKNFEILEVTDRLTQNVNVFDFVGSNITKVVLDGGIDNDLTISGLDSGSTIVIKAGASAATDDLTVLINNAVTNTKDVLNLTLQNDKGGAAGTTDFGGIHLDSGGQLIETVNINSVSDTFNAGDVNKLDFTNQPVAASNYALHLTGTTTITFDNAQSVSTVDAPAFTGGINGTFFNGNGSTVVINAANAGTSNITGSGGTDTYTITLGNGNNTVTMTGGENDVITVGSGSNLIEAGDGADQVTFGAHSAATVDTIQFNVASDSSLSLPDVVKGFNQATDQINILFATNGGVNYDEVSSDGALAATLTALNTAAADGRVNVVLNISTGHVFIDINSDGILQATDMEINLVGVTHLTAGQFHT